MSKRLTFAHLLAIEGIDPEKVQLVRHQDRRAKAVTSPYALWAAGDPGFEAYQRLQGRRVFRLDEGSLIASFVVTPSAETLFVGMYGVHGIDKAGPDAVDPVGGYGCKPDSPPEISSRVERIIAASVEAMIAAGHQPAILPRATADALAKMGIGPTGFSTLYGGD